MRLIESIELRDVLGLVPKPRYILGTTYTLSLAFFESAVFPEFDRSRLKSCLIISDSVGYQNALTEAGALQGAAQDYMVMRAPVSGSFHPKVWLVLGEDDAVLMTGSGNLTQAGFMTNAEVFDALHFAANTPLTTVLRSDIRSFLSGLAGMWRVEDQQHLLCIETLQAIEQAVAGLPATEAGSKDAIRFLHSFRGPLLEQLPEAENAQELNIAAPYFGDSLEGLNLLSKRFPAAKLHIFPAVHSGSSTNIPLEQLRKAYPKVRASTITIPGKKDAFAHLKLYSLVAAENAWLFCTSANCTLAAWQGPNVEAGLLRPMSVEQLKGYFVAGSEKLPSGRLEIQGEQREHSNVQCWAEDSGAGLDLLISNDHRHLLPLSNVEVTVRAGSGLAVCQRPSLFQQNCSAHIPWTAFQGWQRRRKVSICVELQARAANGNPVRGVCLVENRLLLSADPVHRSAWRGALALLDAEGAPELGDIAAIFNLAGEIFDGTLVPPPESEPADDKPKISGEAPVERKRHAGHLYSITS